MVHGGLRYNFGIQGLSEMHHSVYITVFASIYIYLLMNKTKHI